MTASCPAVVVCRLPRPDPENTVGSSETSLPAPVVFDATSRANWFWPTCSAWAVTPAFAPLMAATTELSDPLPTETFWAVTLPICRPPGESSAWIVPPLPEARVTGVWPLAATSVTVVEVPSTEIIPSVPLTALPAESPRALLAEPLPT